MFLYGNRKDSIQRERPWQNYILPIISKGDIFVIVSQITMIGGFQITVLSSFIQKVLIVIEMKE